MTERAIAHTAVAPDAVPEADVLVTPASTPLARVARTARAPRMWRKLVAPLGLAVLLAIYLVLLLPWMTNWGATADERGRRLPGDELVPLATDQSTRAITVHAPADETWRWLVQIGEDRAGFYSYTWLENLFGADIHNADRVHPEWQTLHAGDLVRAVPDDYLGGILPQPGWRVAAVEPGHWFVLRGWGVFLVEPVDATTSRVIVRTRFRDETWWGPIVTRLAFAPVHFVMERRMLLGLRDRAEGRAGIGGLDVVAGAGFAAVAVAVTLLFLRRRQGRAWLAAPTLLLGAVLAGTGDVLAGVAGFIALGLVLLALPRLRTHWPALLPVVAGVLLVLLLAPDAYLAFGLLFLAGSIGWSAAWALRTRTPAGGAPRGAALPLLLAAAALVARPMPASSQDSGYAPGRALAEAVERYRELAAGPDLRPSASRRVVRPGDVYPAADTLRRYLFALGDLGDGSSSPAAADADTVYDDDLVKGVVAFQARHGLEPDGIIGPATMAAIRVPLTQRAHQLEVALERWRQLPDTVPERVIVVNVPAFRLYAFERDAATGRPVLRMNVIVGQAQGRHATPLFSGSMREVVFQPYWDVPPSIARAELLPRIRRDPGYLAREHLEIVRGGDHDATIYRPTASNLSRVAAGDLRLRQRPGPWNALGPVKFVFPNRYNVYLHGTPAQELFARARRDFSHGCIRVEDPTALARWVLDGQAGWDGSAVAAAMTTGRKSRRVALERPVPVHVLYATAVVGDDGVVRFYPDIYGHDGSRVEAQGRATE